AAIAARLTDFYRAAYPRLKATRQNEIETAIQRVQEIYAYTRFPAMRVDWRTYPDNIGHLYAPGCFRCHDGRHVDPFGDPIRRDCTLCHD
ncbi:MAG TPA: cytochrome C, partial [Proteobacteria bacterium]|nr:cytochrome C [Pseudomonadota bacterium]